MKRSFSISANSDIQRNQAKQIQEKLRSVYYQLETLDMNTFNEIDGYNMMEDLDIYIRQIDTVLNKID